MTAPATPRKRWRPVARAAVTVVVLVAVGWLFWRALSENWEQVRAHDLSPNWLMALAVVIFAAAVPVSGLLWGAILNRLSEGYRVGAGEAISVHSASWLLKYIPGQVGSVLNKVIWAGRRGVSRALVLITVIYENVFLQVASIVPSLAVLALTVGVQFFGNNAATVLLPLVVVVPLLIVFHPRLFRAIVGFLGKKILKAPLPAEYFLRTSDTVRFVAGFTVPRIINGVGFVIVAASFMDVPPEAWLPLAAAYVLAGAVGILAVFVPSGLGVREAVIFVFALAYLTPAQAVILAVLSRLLSTLADVVVAAYYVILKFTVGKEQAP